MRAVPRTSVLVAMSLFVLVAVTALGGGTAVARADGPGRWQPDPNLRVERHFDARSATHYFLVRVEHRDRDGNLVRLQHTHADNPEGETVAQFAERMGDPLLAINASTMYGGQDPVVQPVGIQIIDGVVVQDEPVATRYTLGIHADNTLEALPPGIDGAGALAAGVTHALTAFIPLVEEGEPVSDEVLGLVSHVHDPHPRQVIAQLPDKDLLVLSTGGRGIDGAGMGARDLIRILLAHGAEFAFMLDGGGSTATVVEGEQITPDFDNHGTEARLRPNFLHIRAGAGQR